MKPPFRPPRRGSPRVPRPISLCLSGLLLISASDRLEGASLLLEGATVHTVSGETLTQAGVLIREGKIAAVGKSLPAADARRVDLSGLHLYPGLIALNTVLGLTEISAVRATEDLREVGEFTPDVQSWIAVNPDSELLGVARANGVAFFEPVPQGAVVSGQSGLLSVEGWTTEQMTISKPIALHFFWPTMELDTTPRGPARAKGKAKSIEEQARERRTKLQSALDFFEEAKAYARARGGTNQDQTIPAWEAMFPFVRAQLPIVVHADEIRQIRSMVSWAATNGFRVYLAGGRDAWMAANLLATNHIPVIYGHTYTLPARDTDSYDVHFAAPRILNQAGVRVVFSLGWDSFNAPLVRNLPYTAAQAEAFGLPAAEALKGITLYPAELAGVADRLGSIAAGKDATLFAADGDILDLRTQVKRMWIAGEETNLDNRQSRLYEKYKHRPPPADR